MDWRPECGTVVWNWGSRRREILGGVISSSAFPPRGFGIGLLEMLPSWSTWLLEEFQAISDKLMAVGCGVLGRCVDVFVM